MSNNKKKFQHSLDLLKALLFLWCNHCWMECFELKTPDRRINRSGKSLPNGSAIFNDFICLVVWIFQIANANTKHCTTKCYLHPSQIQLSYMALIGILIRTNEVKKKIMPKWLCNRSRDDDSIDHISQHSFHNGHIAYCFWIHLNFHQSWLNKPMDINFDFFSIFA